MEHRTKQDLALINLVSDFEVNLKRGQVKYLDVKEYGQLIDYYENDGHIEKAIRVAKVALKQFKYRAEFYITISHLLLKVGEITQCLEYLEQAGTIAPYENEVTILKARAFIAAGQFNNAFDCLENASLYASKEEELEIYICEADLHSEMGNFEQTYDLLVKALEVDPHCQEALEKIWFATEQCKKYIQSIALHQAIIDKDPYNHLAWFNLGHAMAYEGNYEDAASAIEYSFIINSSFEDGYMDCADIYCQLQKYDKALCVYEEAIEIFGVDSDLLTNIAECQLHLGELLQAKQNLYKAVRLDQHSDQVYFLLAETYAKQQKWYSAINAYHKAVEIEDGCEDYYLGLARAYIAVEEYNKATVNFQLAVSLEPEQTKYWREFASFLIKMGLYTEALQVLDEAEEFTFGADLLYIRALALFFNKEKQVGLSYLEEALVEDYTKHNILFALAPELEVDTEINSMISYFKGEC